MENEMDVITKLPGNESPTNEQRITELERKFSLMVLAMEGLTEAIEGLCGKKKK